MKWRVTHVPETCTVTNGYKATAADRLAFDLQNGLNVARIAKSFGNVRQFSLTKVGRHELVDVAVLFRMVVEILPIDLYRVVDGSRSRISGSVYY